MTSFNFAPILTRLMRVRHAAMAVLWLGCAAAHAQDALPASSAEVRAGDPVPAADLAGHRWADAFVGLRSFASIDMGPGGNLRLYRGLRLRFDSATHAMRHLGVPADECATVLRSTRHASAEGSSQLGMSVTLNCRFF